MRSHFLIKGLVLIPLLLQNLAAAEENCGGPPSSSEAASHYRKAMEMAEKEVWEGAILEFQRALDNEPENSLTLIELGIAYGQIERWDPAVQVHQRVAKLVPDCVRAHYNLGVSLDRQNLRGGSGNREYRLVLQLDPRYVPAMINLASNLGDHDSKEARILLERALQVEPDNPSVQLNLGLLLERMGESDAAQRSFEKVIDSDLGALEARTKLSEIWLARKNWGAVIRECREILKLDPENREIRYRLGQALIQAGKGEEGRKQLEAVEALRREEMEQQELQAWLQEGGANLSQGKVSAAIESFRKAVATDRNSADARMYLGIGLAASGRYEEGLQELRKAVRMQPSNARIRHNLGAVLLEAGKENEAEQSFRKSLDLDPYFAESHNSMGLILSRRNKTQEAVRYFRNASQLNPYYFEALFNLGLALRSLGRLQEAVHAFRQAVRVASDSPQAYYALGLSLKELGDMDGARKALEKAESLASALQ